MVFMQIFTIASLRIREKERKKKERKIEKAVRTKTGIVFYKIQENE